MKYILKGIIYEIPSGVVFNNAFLSNVGPKVPVKIKYSGNVGLDVKTRVKKYGINSHLKRIRVKDKELYLRELQGKINFVLQIEKDNVEFIKYKNQIKKI